MNLYESWKAQLVDHILYIFVYLETLGTVQDFAIFGYFGVELFSLKQWVELHSCLCAAL